MVEYQQTASLSESLASLNPLPSDTPAQTQASASSSPGLRSDPGRAGGRTLASVGPSQQAQQEPQAAQPAPVAPSHKPRTRGVLNTGVAARLNLAIDLLGLFGLLVFGHQLIGLPGHPEGLPHTVPLALFACGVWAIVSTAMRHYTSHAYQSTPLDDAAMTAVILVAVFTSFVALNTLYRVAGSTPTDLRLVLLDFVFALAVRPVFRALSKREIPSDDVIIVGAGIRGRLIGESIERSNHETVLGLVAFDGERAEPGHLPFLGQFDALERILRTMPVSKVYIAGNALKDGASMQNAITTCEQLGVPFALPAYSFRLGRAQPQGAEHLEHGYVHYVIHAPAIRARAVKRTFDIVSSAVALWVLLPLLVLVAAIVKFSSKGPIFFKQERVGLNGRKFNMLKFRSMVINAEEIKASLARMNEQTGPVFKMQRDPRVTAFGRFIRKFSIDELPQLINVLRGDMSIVGPRPPVPSEVAQYEAWQLRRLSVRPGLTCLWQVSGRNQISFEEWMYLDMQYIDHWSLMQDLRLILRTVPVVFTGRGSS